MGPARDPERRDRAELPVDRLPAAQEPVRHLHAAPLSTVYSIPPVILYYTFKRYLVSGLVSGAVSGS